MFANPMSNRRIDGVFRDVTLDAEIIVVDGILFQLAALKFHLVGGLPGAADNFSDASHGLGI